MILATENHAAQGALRRIVIECETRLVDESHEAWPEFAHVSNRLAERALRQGALLERPCVNAFEQLTRALCARLRAVLVSFTVVLDGVELPA